MKKFLFYLATVVLLAVTFSCNDDLIVTDPIISPDGGLLVTGQEITIACSTVDSTIYYTIDGTEPTDSSTPYTVPFTITEETTVKSIAYKSDYTDSTVKVASFRIDSYVHVFVQGGSFSMGSDTGGEVPVHNATVSDFYISKYETTQKEYEAVIGSNPSSVSDGIGLNKPVNEVSWHDAVVYCNALSTQEGLTPCYSGTVPDISCNFSANGYRLPTEAEWEYASRGGASSLGYIYSGSNTVGDVAWYSGNDNDVCEEVGTKSPNELEIYDMSGNLYEWCWDWYDEEYYSDETADDLDTSGPPTGTNRVIRGGSWSSYGDSSCRSAYRNSNTPSSSSNNIGFRLVRRS